jgi:hypothetical protein
MCAPSSIKSTGVEADGGPTDGEVTPPAASPAMSGAPLEGEDAAVPDCRFQFRDLLLDHASLQHRTLIDEDLAEPGCASRLAGLVVELGSALLGTALVPDAGRT